MRERERQKKEEEKKKREREREKKKVAEMMNKHVFIHNTREAKTERAR